MSPEPENTVIVSELNPTDVVGGKGNNLLRLNELGVKVPDFRIIPIGAQYSLPQLKGLYDSLPKPLAVRSSSPWEDSKGYSFAGLFESVLNVSDFESFLDAVQVVLASAKSEQVYDYAQQHGLTIDDRMAVIVQEMIKPKYSGVCYSTDNPSNPKTIVEFVAGLSDQLMSGNVQGNLTSFDADFKQKTEYRKKVYGLKQVAKVVRKLEGTFGERLDVEFAISEDEQVYIVQARPVTDPTWPEIQIPEIENSQVLLNTDIVRGSGSFTGQVFVFRSPTEMLRYAQINNKQAMIETTEQWRELREFNKNHPDGFCLVADNLEAHKIIMKNGGLSNLRALVTADYASRFSHPLKVVSETGAFYLGILGRKDLLDLIKTGDTLTAASDQSRGLVYDLIKPVVEQMTINLEGIPVVQYEDALEMSLPSYEEVEDRLFLSPNGEIGIKFWDYNEQYGVPTEVFYAIVDRNGRVISNSKYLYYREGYRHSHFPSLLADLLNRANK